MLVINFYARQESAYKSKTLICIKCLAHNLINRICGEVDTAKRPRQTALVPLAYFLRMRIILFRISHLACLGWHSAQFCPQNMCRTLASEASKSAAKKFCMEKISFKINWLVCGYYACQHPCPQNMWVSHTLADCVPTRYIARLDFLYTGVRVARNFPSRRLAYLAVVDCLYRCYRTDHRAPDVSPPIAHHSQDIAG